MLYLEDYVELIEHLPVDLRDRFTDMRELDLQVQNTVDELNGRVKALFRECSAKKGKVDNADEVFEDIRATYRKALDDADEKVQLAGQVYDLVDRHLRKLDQELAKFKMELEADNGGITEILEQRSLELDNPVSHPPQSSRRHAHSNSTVSHSTHSTSAATMNGPAEKKLKLDIVDNWHSESAPSSVMSSEIGLLTSLEPEKSRSRPPSRSSISGSRHSTASNADATEFQHAEHVPRRTNSKCDPEPIKQEMNSTMNSENSFHENQSSLKAEDMIDNDSSQSGMDMNLTSPYPGGSRPSRTKKQTSRAAAWTQERMQAEARRGHARDRDHGAGYSGVEVTEGASTGWTCDPHEPRYCLCNQVSYGEMVGCDNPKCAIEWFHYECVNLTEAPKGKWYCPQCTQSMKRRNKNKSAPTS